MAETVKPINGFKIGDVLIGTDILGCLVASLNEDGSFKNLQIVTNPGHKINIESGDNVAIKPMGNLQHDTAHYPVEEDKNEFKMKAICDSKDAVEGYNIEAAGVKFITKKADTTRGWDPKKWVLKIQESATKYAKGIINAASWDIRARSTGAGTGGGIAVQIAGVDSDIHANKFKIETDQTADVTATQSEDIHCGEGGKGIEIGTINPLFTSLYTKDYRFRSDAPIFAVSRGPITMYDKEGHVTTDATLADKIDYPTQRDDSKDIIPDEQIANPVCWGDLVEMLAEWKASKQG